MPFRLLGARQRLHPVSNRDSRAALAAYGQSSQADEQKNSVRGTVINQLTHAPVPRALVYSPDNRYAAMTDGDGRFEFTLPKANTKTRDRKWLGLELGRARSDRRLRETWTENSGRCPVGFIVEYF